MRHRSVVNQLPPGQASSVVDAAALKRVNVFKPNQQLKPTRTNDYLMIQQQKQKTNYANLHVTPEKKGGFG